MDLEKTIANSFPGFLSIRNSKHQLIYLNENFKNWIKTYTDIDPIGKTNEYLSKLVNQNVANVFKCCHDASLDFLKHNNSENSLKRVIPFNEDEGSTKYFEVVKYGQIIEDENHIVTVCFDITNLYKENERNFVASQMDPLTGAYNRNFITNKDQKFFENYTFICLDLDNYKMVNDIYGHIKGDKILTGVSSLFLKVLKEDEYLIRLGGDEFLFLFKHKSVEDAYILLEEVRRRFVEDFFEYPYLSFSYGGCLFYKTVEKTIKKADAIMYTKKFNKK